MGPDVRLDSTMIGASPNRDDSRDRSRSQSAIARDPEHAEILHAQRDPHAFAPLYQRYVDAVFGYCYRRTSDREVAADLTSQIFARALAALPRYQPQAREGTFRSWLFSIAHNLVVDTHRTRRDHRPLDGIEEPQDHAPSPEDQVIAREDRQALARAIGSLTTSQRHVVALRLAGLTGPEIAGVLGMRLPAVKSAQFRAYARLRDLLESDFAFDRMPTPPDQPSTPKSTQEPTDA